MRSQPSLKSRRIDQSIHIPRYRVGMLEVGSSGCWLNFFLDVILIALAPSTPLIFILKKKTLGSINSTLKFCIDKLPFLSRIFLFSPLFLLFANLLNHDFALKSSTSLHFSNETSTFSSPCS